ncbi:putative protein involved in methicillin resistance [Bacteroidales bacterium Barb7]|nr:putative protein involved in methicillin resistance [Bacteroidales bacterium Barb7]
MTNKDKYRALCQTEPSIPLFSRDWWLDAVCGGENGWDVLLVEEDGQVAAALPLYIPYKGVVAMPLYTQSMGPWFAPASENTKYVTGLGRRQAFCKTFIKTLQNDYPRFQQNFHYGITDWLPFYWEGYQQTTRYTYLLQDLSNLDAVWKEMSQHTRRNITRAKEKYAIAVKKGISATELVKVCAKTFARQGVPFPATYARLLERLVALCRSRGQGDVWGGYDREGHLCAAVFVVWQESSAYYLAGGGDPLYRDSSAHSFAMWEAIRHVALSGKSRQFDFEGSMLPGVERFFREFGAVQMPYFAVSKGELSLLRRVWYKLKRLV